MNRHFRAYAEAYFVGLLFVLLQICLAFIATAKLYPPAVRQAMSGFDWTVFWAVVLATCLPTIIAFLNGAVQRGRAKQDSLPPDGPGSRSGPKVSAGTILPDPRVQAAIDRAWIPMKPNDRDQPPGWRPGPYTPEKTHGPIVNTSVTPEEIAASRPDIATGPVVHDPTLAGNESSPTSEAVKVDPRAPAK